MNVIPETMELLQLGAGSIILVMVVMIGLSGLAKLIETSFWR